VVLCGDSLPGETHCSVVSDHRKGGAQAARHLIECGCRHFAFLGDAVAPDISERLAGCRTALAEAGLSDAMATWSTLATATPTDPSFSKWLEDTRAAPAGIIAASDFTAIRALHILSESGFSVPDDIRVIGFDDFALAERMSPPLTPVTPDLSSIASVLVDLLLRRISGENAESVLVEPILVVRQSS
jgi:DNA-binding LacI/PurR family transcriptional regulator